MADEQIWFSKGRAEAEIVPSLVVAGRRRTRFGVDTDWGHGGFGHRFPRDPTYLVTPAPDILLASDSVAKKVYFYKVPGMTLTGQLDNVDLGSVHGGAITLPEVNFPSLTGESSVFVPSGHVIFADVPNQQIIIVHLNIKGEIKSVDRVPADLGDEVLWTALDPTFRYYAAPSVHFDGNLDNTVNLIDLKTLKNTRIPVTMSQDEDPHPFLVGNPFDLKLFVSLGDRIDGFKVRDVIGGNLTASSSFPVDPGLAHGNFVSPKTNGTSPHPDRACSLAGSPGVLAVNSTRPTFPAPETSVASSSRTAAPTHTRLSLWSRLEPHS